MSENQVATTPCDNINGNLSSCGYKGVANPAVVGIVVGCVAFVLIVLLLIFCCRRERVLKSHTKEEKANLGRRSIAGIKSSIAALRTSTALNEMSNVSKGVLKRKILEQLVIKTVDTDGSTDKKESFLQSLSKSNRAYSSFAAALSSTGNTTAVKFVDADADAPDVEKGDITATEEQLNNEDEEPAAAAVTSSPSIDRRRSNSMARSLSMKLTKKDDTSKCYLCLMAYTQGEEVAFSKNNKCKHQFHKDCIVEWLMKRTACPCCREEYIESNEL